MRHARAFSISPVVIVLALLSMGLGYFRLQSLPTPQGNAAYARGNAIGFVTGPVIMGGLLGLGAYAVFRRSDRAFNITLGTFLGLSVLSHTAFMIIGKPTSSPAASGGPGATGASPRLAQRDPAPPVASQPVSDPRPGPVMPPGRPKPPASPSSPAPQPSPPATEAPSDTAPPAKQLPSRPDSRKLPDVAKWSARGVDAAQAPLGGYAKELQDQLVQATALAEAAYKALGAAPPSSKAALTRRRDQGEEAAKALDKAARRLRTAIDTGRDLMKDAGIDQHSAAAIAMSFSIEGRTTELAMSAEAVAEYLRAIGERDGVLHDNLGKWTAAPGGKLTSKDHNVQFQIDSTQGKVWVFAHHAERALTEIVAVTK